ncbi:MAG: ATP-binding protein [Elusimicrobia bacterium]|nr:ATP-binding protein [Elusimicrobiota bacterium]
METSKEISGTLLSAMDQIYETVFLTDSEGTILYANPAFEKLTGFTPSDFLGKKPNILKSGAHSRDFYKEMWDTLKAGEPWVGRLVNKRKDGSQYTEELRVCPVKTASGEIKYFFAILRDITKELTLEAQLLQSQKMESLGLLSGQLSHDFNNLLTIVIGSTEVILEDTKDTKENATSRVLLKGILENSKKYSLLLKQLLIFARKHDSDIKAMDLNSMLSDILPLIKTTLSARIKLEYDLGKDLKNAKADSEQLKQVIINILMNARDAMPEGGMLAIKTENISLKDGALHLLKGGEYILLTISDTGCGIPPETLDHIFEPFFTTKPKGKGTGLGLSTAYGIIANHNGKILVKSEPGKGTAFYIYLPAA